MSWYEWQLQLLLVCNETDVFKHTLLCQRCNTWKQRNSISSRYYL